VTPALRGALGKAEGDQSLRAHLSEALLERGLACSRTMGDVLRLGEEECTGAPRAAT
jgi:hypothetical protein